MAENIKYDSIGPFPDGCNSGVQPLLLPKTQLAWLINGTVRGGYITHRPTFLEQTLDFGGDEELQAAVEHGFFQGAAPFGYRPDFGPFQNVAQISGRLFAFTDAGIETWTVSEITVSGDPNDATTTQVWMWQSEKWLIVSDGTGKLPIFYDGVTSRRSYGPSVVLGTVGSGAAFPSPRVIGEIITVTLTADWTGPFDVPVLYNGAYYQPIQSGSGGYEVTLTNVQATPGATVATGSQVIVRPGLLGFVTQVAAVLGGGTLFVIVVTGRHVDYIGYKDAGHANPPPLLINGTLFWIRVVTNPPPGNPVNLELDAQFPTTINVGDQIVASANSAPAIIIGNTTAPFVVPAVGGTVSAFLDMPYTGASGQTVWIGQEQYTIASVPAAPGTTLNLINLTDTSDAGGAIPVGDPDGNILSVAELPAGRMGVYGMGQNWMSLVDGITYIVSDPVRGASGTPANDYRDAVLKYTELTFRGGKFSLPSSGNIINSMTFIAALDQSMGQGPIQIGTDTHIYSAAAPVDFTALANTTGPIIAPSLIGRGPLSQNGTILSNSDVLFRSADGLGSLKIARREFTDDLAGNTPISREVERALSNDVKTLLSYGSSSDFDNRFLTTCYPNVSANGVFHQGCVALNLDLISNLRGKAPPSYDGLWTGLNILQITSEETGINRRSFFFGYNITEEKLELYRQRTSGNFDNDDTRILWIIETPVIFHPGTRPSSEVLLRLANGQIHVRDIVGIVHVKVLYRPDFWPCWVTWREFDLCADTTVTDGQPGYRTPVGIGEPSPDSCEENNNRPFRVGRFFQVRFEITGSMKFMGADFGAAVEPTMLFAKPECDTICEDTIPLPQ